MFKYTYKCDCCQTESEITVTDDTVNPPRLPADWRRFHLEACDQDDREHMTWTEEMPTDLCPTCAEYFRNAMTEYKAAIAHFNKTPKPKGEKAQ